MDIKKIDIKSVFIIILGVLLILSIIIGQRSNIDINEDELSKLEKLNKILEKKNDSLLLINTALDKEILSNKKIIQENDKKLSDTQSQLDDLKKKRNEVSNNVNNLSANGVSSAFSDYLNKNTKSTNNSK